MDSKIVSKCRRKRPAMHTKVYPQICSDLERGAVDLRNIFRSQGSSSSPTKTCTCHTRYSDSMRLVLLFVALPLMAAAPLDPAWQVLEHGIHDSNPGKRVQAVTAM